MDTILITADARVLDRACLLLIDDIKACDDGCNLKPFAATLASLVAAGPSRMELKQVVVLCCLQDSECLSHLKAPAGKWCAFAPELGALTTDLFNGDTSITSYLHECSEAWVIS